MSKGCLKIMLLVVLLTTTLGLRGAAQYQVVLTPDGPSTTTVGPIAVEPADTASVTFSATETDVWKLVGIVQIGISGPENFIWKLSANINNVMSYLVLNASWAAAQTVVTVEATWIRKAPGGGKGSGGATLLKKRGEAIAASLTGMYVVKCAVPSIGIEDTTTVYAYAQAADTGALIAAPSDWTATAPGQLLPPVQNTPVVTVTGENAGTTIITGRYVPNGYTDSLGLYIVEVASLAANEGTLIANDGTNRLYLVAAAATGQVTVTATPNPLVAEEDLPLSWSLTGGSGAGKLYRTVSKSVSGKTLLTCSSGTSIKKTAVAVIKVDIAQTVTNVCWKMTNAVLNLTADSFWAGADGGSVIWSSAPAGLGGVGNNNSNFWFNPSNSTPTSYVVKAWSSLLPNCQDACTVRVFKVDIEQLETNVCWKMTNAVLNLTADSFWAEAVGGSVTWASSPDGLGGVGYNNTNFWFNPSNSMPTSYVVTARSSLLTNCYDTCTVTVLKVNMIPDWNHDRVIDNSDKDQATASNPFHFWINDDADYGDISVGDVDVPGHGSGADYHYAKVCGRSDLLDFFPVWLDLNQALNVLPPSDTVQYKLRQDDGAVKVVYTDLTKDHAGDYLTTEGNTYGPSFNQNSYEADKLEITSDGVMLTTNFLNKIKNDAAQGVLMVEGANASTKPLVLEVWKDGHKFCEKEMPLSIDGVEKMYRWINVRGAAGGGVSRATDINEPTNYPDSNCNGKQFIFVHGYSVDENYARGWGAEMFKRFYQSGSRAMFTTVTWFGNDSQAWWWLENTPNYFVNVTHAFETASNLVTAVTGLPGQKYIAAHSLGNMLVTSAIKNHGLNVNAYFMLDAAVAQEAYDASVMYRDEMRNPDWQNYSNKLWSAEWYQLFDSSDGRYNLTWRNRFGNLTVAYNYYSSGEDVLNNGNGTLPAFLASEWAWVNQEMRKGVWPLLVPGNNQAGWGFNHDYDVPDYTNDQGQVFYKVMPPDQANQLSPDSIRTNSFFRHFDTTELYGTNGNTVAQDWHLRAQVLAEGIPALSRAMGRNQLNNFGGGNLDMMTQKNNGTWPSVRNGRWLHSDVKDVAYPYNYPVFDDIRSKGGLQ